MGKKKVVNYAKRAAALRKIGVPVKLGQTKRQTSQQKSAVTRQWEKFRLYLEPGKQKFVHVVANTAAKKKAIKAINPKARTPNGYFVRIPTNAKKFKIKFEGENLRVDVQGMGGGRRIQRTVALDPDSLAEDPQKEIRRAFREAKGKENFHQVKMVVNGFDARPINVFDSQSQFFEYAEDFFLSATQEDHEAKFPGRFHGRQMDEQTFADIFHLKVISQTPSSHGKKSKRRKTAKHRRS